MPIKVLLVDDSPTARLILSQMVNSAPDMKLVGQAVDGLQAVQMVTELSPDIILMDVTMPRMDGLEATREIMNVKPTPIIVISATAEANETSLAFEAVNAGALQVLQKPGGPQSPNYDTYVKGLLDTLRAMSDVRVIRHVKSGRSTASGRGEAPSVPTRTAQIELIAIVSSTGGPQALGEIIKTLPANFSLPVVIVQHIAPDFVTPLVDWLSTLSRLPVRVAQPGAHPLPGTIYIAPGSKHLVLTRDRRFELSDTPANLLHMPSGDVLLESVARSYGPRGVGVVLTGMGADGARGLRAMYDEGAMTIAQNEASCIVFGMPQQAIALGAARLTLPPTEIGRVLQQYSS